MNYICNKCGNASSLEMMDEVKELVYECEDTEDVTAPGDCYKITFICKDACLQGVK